MIPKKTWAVRLNGEVVHDRLITKQVLNLYPHKSIKAFMKYAQPSQWHAILTEQYRAGELTVTRIQ